MKCIELKLALLGLSIKHVNQGSFVQLVKSSAAANAVFGAALIAVVAKVGHKQVSFKGGD
jgi:hypothetical protein